MKVILKACLFILFFVFCSERNRTNQYDVTSKGFAAPPCCYTWGQPVYDPYGYLVAVQIGIEYTDPMPKTLSFDYKFIVNGDNVLNVSYPVNEGETSFGIEIHYGGNPFPLGDYCLKIYWGEFGYGAFAFKVISTNGVAKYKGSVQYDETKIPSDWYKIDLAQ